MLLRIELELTEKQVKYIYSNSIERVINTALGINRDMNAQLRHEDGWINAEDLEECKPIVTWLWNAAREAANKAT